MYKFLSILIFIIFLVSCSSNKLKQEKIDIDFSDQTIQCKYIFFGDISKDSSLNISDLSVFLSKSNNYLDLDSTRFSSSISALSTVYNIFKVQNKKLYITKIYIPSINSLYNYIDKQLNRYKTNLVYERKNTKIYNINFQNENLYIKISLNSNGISKKIDNNILNIIKDAKLTNRYNGAFYICIGKTYDNNEIKDFYKYNNPIVLKLLKLLSENGYISILTYGEFNLAIFKGKVYTFKNIENLDLRLIDI